MTENEPETHWHLDRRIPIALIITLALNTGVGIWWLAALGSRVEMIERQVDRGSNLAGEIIQIREQLRGLERVMLRLEAYVDRRQTLREPAEQSPNKSQE
jgi:hypothetical protein